MKSVKANLAASLVCTALVASNVSSVADDAYRGRPDVLILEQLKDVGLSDAQAATIEKLAAELGPRLADAEAKAAPTPAQRAARERAIRDAIAQGKRGAGARPIIAAAFALTDEQRLAAARVGTLRQEFDRAVFALLTDSQKEKLATSAYRLEQYTGFIVVRLTVDVPGELDDLKSLDEVAKAQNLTGLHDAIVALGLTDSQRLIRNVPDPHAPDAAKRREVERLVRRLRSYWRIDARSKSAPIETILRRLQATAGIDLAYLETTISSPSVMPADDPYNAQQGYLDPAPAGIDARFAWTRPDGDGAGVGLVDVECDWNEYHEDLKGKLPTLIFGDSKAGEHGTGVLGTVVAEDNTVGVVGVAPSPAYVFLTSWYQIGRRGDRLAEGIVSAASLMHPGDVLLLEVERYCKPVELWDAEYDAIRYATAHGIVAIEAAGNGGFDLDRTADHAGRFVLNRASADFRDSGAIVVGASDPRDSHNRPPFSCYGSRVDCFAWGRYVVTCGSGDLDDGGGDDNKTYRKAFGGTSSAASIVAGAAMIVQARIKGRTGGPATSQEIRSLLADPGTGTPQGTGAPGNIGVMPNLRAIIEAEDASDGRHDGR